MAKQYIEPQKRYEDHKSTGILFLAIGAVGAVITILCWVDVLKFPLNGFQLGILMGMFVAFIGFGGEPFTQYAADARAAAPDKFVIASCNTNGNAGYLPTKEAFEEGGYEAKGTTFTAGLVELLGKTIKEMLSDKEV